MKVLFDTNILLDVFLQRKPFYNNSAQVMGLAEQGKIEGWLCGTTVTTVHYLLAKALSKDKAEKHLKDIFKVFHIANITRPVLEDALHINFKDFEDAVIYQSALHAKLQVILTRNQKDFGKSDLPVYNPLELLKLLNILE